MSFAVVCQPASGADVDGFRSRLTLDSLPEFLPAPDVLAGVADQLITLGFEVFDLPGPVVSARGPVGLFRSTFHAELVRRKRPVVTPFVEKTTVSIVLAPQSPAPTVGPLRGAAHVVVLSRPRFVVPRAPASPARPGLHLPGDLAQFTGSSATHRLSTPLGDRATGSGVAVAVLEAGFGDHPYFTDHGYRITREAMPDVADPEVDENDGHGALVLASLFACAPDVHAYGLKIGEDATLGFRYALTVPSIRVVSCSWVDNIGVATALPIDLLPLELTILSAISAGITVVAAAGNGQRATFPAMMPDVIAVGGVAIGPNDGIEAWSQTSSFSSAVFAGRNVPDFCAIASTMWIPSPGTPPDWTSIDGGTSSATPQIAGVAALLLQKNPQLTPAAVRSAIAVTADDVTIGTASGIAAGPGTDPATGAGFVNALKAWQSV